MTYFIKSLRPFNLIIIAITQYLIYYLVMAPSLQYGWVSNLLNPTLFSLLVLDTVLIAASGYVINDIIDEKTDRINNKLKYGFTKKKALSWYVFLTCISILIAIYVAYSIDNLALALLNPLAVVTLFLYSKYFKQSVLIGNIIVSLFCAFVPGIIWFAERRAFSELRIESPDMYALLELSLIGFIIFGFVATMYREIVKDIEDVEGDKLAGYNTLAIAWGSSKAKVVGISFGILLLFSELIWNNMYSNTWDSPMFWYFLFTVLLPTMYTIYRLFGADSKESFHQISTIIKIIMLTGLIYLLIVYYNAFPQ